MDSAYEKWIITRGPSLCEGIADLALVEHIGGLGFSTYSFIFEIKFSTKNHVTLSARPKMMEYQQAVLEYEVCT